MPTTSRTTALTSRLVEVLREAPATLPALVAVALFLVWAADEAGFPVTHWAPGGLILLGLLAVALGCVGVRWREMPIPVRVALGCLAGYTALSFLSIIWADVPGAAWEGANRTLLYLMAFALFACWPRRGRSAVLLLGTWSLAMVGLALFVLLRLDAASSAGLRSLIPGGRLVYPAGYPNAAAAQWLMAFWPGVLLARSRALAPWLRGLLAGGSVLLADLALLSQSRGSFYATPVMLILVFVLLPGRLRTFAVLVPVAVGVGAGTPAILAVGDHLTNGNPTTGAMHSAVAAGVAASVGVGLVVALGAAFETRSGLTERARGRIRAGLRVAALATLLLVLAGALAVAGNPVTRIKSGWDSFKGGYGADSATGTRLLSGLGSNRYDFYRVALDEFVAHPVLGIGADNFEQQYLAHGRSDETPHYPHSVELRTLTQTGLVGALLALVGLGAALIAVARAVRESDPLGRAVAAAAVAGFAYWLVHGSFDWFWEFAGLGAPAFALLGLACSLAPARRRDSSPGAAAPGAPPAGTGAVARSSIRRPLVIALCALAGGAIAVSLAAPWLSELEVESAARVWTRAPQSAYSRLDDAARLNPLSDQAYLVAGSIALRYGDLARADREFASALQRTPGDAYATLELGSIASAEGHRSRAMVLLERAVRLNPRDPLAREALKLAAVGRRVNVDELNRLILLNAEQAG